MEKSIIGGKFSSAPFGQRRDAFLVAAAKAVGLGRREAVGLRVAEEERGEDFLRTDRKSTGKGVTAPEKAPEKGSHRKRGHELFSAVAPGVRGGGQRSSGRMRS